MDGYVRVSHVGGRDGESFQSPEIQKEAITRYAEAHGIKVDQWHIDLDQSGGKTERPALNEAMDRITSAESDGLIVFRLNRFARLVKALELIEVINGAGAEFVSVSESFDTRTASGQLILTVLLALAQYELEQYRENAAIAQRRAIERGVQPGKAAFGYERDSNRRLVPGEFAFAVEEIFGRRASGETWQEIANWLNNEGILPNDGAQWIPQTVKHVISRRTYLGEVNWGRQAKANAHPALVNLRLWDAANAIKGTSPNAVKTTRLLSGLLRCYGCRMMMKGDSYKEKRKGMSGRVGMYRCKCHHGSGDCSEAAVVTSHLLDEYVTSAFLAWADITAIPASGDHEIDAARRRLEEAEIDLWIFRDDLDIQRALGRDGFLDGLKVRTAAVTAAKVALAETRRVAAGVAIPIHSLVEDWETMTVGERRHLLLAAIDFVAVRRGAGPIGERVRIFWKGEAPTDLPTKGTPKGNIRTPIRPFDFDLPVGARVPLPKKVAVRTG